MEADKNASGVLVDERFGNFVVGSEFDHFVYEIVFCHVVEFSFVDVLEKILEDTQSLRAYSIEVYVLRAEGHNILWLVLC